MEKGFSDSYSLNKVFPVFLYFVYYMKRLIKCIKVHYIMIQFKKYSTSFELRAKFCHQFIKIHIQLKYALIVSLVLIE